MAHQEVPPSKAEWQEWQANPVTRWYMSELKERVESMQDKIAAGGAMRQTVEATAFEYAKSVGLTQGMCSAIFAEPPVMDVAS